MTTKIEFYDRVASSLSGNLVDVELAEIDMDTAFLLAKQTFLQMGNANTERDFYALVVQKGTTEYALPVDPDPKILTISNVIRPNNSGISGYDDPFVQSAFDMMFSDTGAGAGQLFILYDLTAQMQENIRKYTVYESEWIHNKRKNTIRFLKAPVSDATYVLDCYHTPSDEALYDNLWVFKYTLAEAKCILGRAYRKFGSLASPTGETQIDGDQLVTEGKEEKRELEEAIIEFQYGDSEGIGIFVG